MEYLQYLNKLNLGDCMEGMKNFPDKYFDLAIVDPPYEIGVCNMNLGKGRSLYRGPRNYKFGNWDIKPKKNILMNYLG